MFLFGTLIIPPGRGIHHAFTGFIRSIDGSKRIGFGLMIDDFSHARLGCRMSDPFKLRIALHPGNEVNGTAQGLWQLLAPGHVLKVIGQVRHHTFHIIQRPSSPRQRLLPDLPVKEFIHPDGLLEARGKLKTISAGAQPGTRCHATAWPRDAFNRRRPGKKAVEPNALSN